MKGYQIQEAFCSKLRLQIISNLISKKLFFTELKNLTNASDGNLSVQLKKLEGWEYIKSEKKTNKWERCNTVSNNRNRNKTIRRICCFFRVCNCG